MFLVDLAFAIQECNQHQLDPGTPYFSLQVKMMGLERKHKSQTLRKFEI